MYGPLNRQQDKRLRLVRQAFMIIVLAKINVNWDLVTYLRVLAMYISHRSNHGR